MAVLIGSTFPALTLGATAFAAGAFIYIAASILAPHVRNESASGNSLFYFGMTMLGVFLMALILLLE